MEVILAFWRGQAAMMTIVLLEASKITLQAVGCGWNAGIIEEMKHVWDGLEQHAASSFKIAEDFTAFRLSIYGDAVA